MNGVESVKNSICHFPFGIIERPACMSKKKIMIVVGTRPEAIKMAPVILAMLKSDVLQPVVVSTGQHREMLDQVNEVFGVTPDMDLDIFEPGQSLNTMLSKIITGIDSAITEIEPDALMVQGDTTSVSGAAMAAFYRSIPVVHLEAGLRSGNLFDPFPEEGNRLITGQISSLHLAPTDQAKANLVLERFNPDQVVVTGNTVIDALLHATKEPKPFTDARVAELAESGREILLVTAHRRENLGENMESIGRAIAHLATTYPEKAVLFPIHRNPKVREAVLPHLENLDNVVWTEPLPYGEFCHALKISHIILTDSGGVQEEAPSLGKPVLVMRKTTERPEAIDAGNARLVGAQTDSIVDAVTELTESREAYAAMSQAINPYGDGQSSERVVAAIAAMLGVGERMPEFSI